MALKVDYKDDVYTGSRQYKITTSGENSTIQDVTVYTQEGDTFGASDINATNTRVNKNTPIVRQNIAVSVTPVAVGSYQPWDTEEKYGYKAEVPVSGLTANSKILDAVMTDTLEESLAPKYDTGADKLIFYTETNDALTGTIFALVSVEVL